MSIAVDLAFRALGAPERLMAVQRRVFAKLDAGELTADAAIAAWIETKMLMDMHARLTKLEKMEDDHG